MVKLSRIYDGLERVTQVAAELAGLPPDTRLADKDTVLEFDRLLREASKVFEDEDFRTIPLFSEAYAYWFYVAVDLYTYVKSLYDLCDVARAHELPPHHGCAHTISSALGDIVRDVGRVRDYVVLAMRPEDLARSRIAGELVRSFYRYDVSETKKFWEIFSKYCMFATSMVCTTVYDIPTVPLGKLLSEMSSSLMRMSGKLIELYHGVKGQRVGSIYLYKHPESPPDLMELAEYFVWIGNIVDKIIGIGSYATTYALKDRVVIRLDFHLEASISITPRWDVEAYIGRHVTNAPTTISVLERILKERGLAVRTTDYGLKITIPSGDVKNVKEAIKILSMYTYLHKRSLYYYGPDYPVTEAVYKEALWRIKEIEHRETLERHLLERLLVERGS